MHLKLGYINPIKNNKKLSLIGELQYPHKNALFIATLH